MPGKRGAPFGNKNAAGGKKVKSVAQMRGLVASAATPIRGVHGAPAQNTFRSGGKTFQITQSGAAIAKGSVVRAGAKIKGSGPGGRPGALGRSR